MTKNIVIIGASRGIGKAVVELLAADPKHQVFALARNETALREFDKYSNVTSLPFDLNSASLRLELEQLFAQVEQIDLLINNAGYLVNKAFSALSHADLCTSYQVNVIGVMESVQALLPKMELNGGHIVNISSMGGFQGTMKFPGLAAYSTSKAALCSFTELFAEEYKTSRVKMNCLCLGAVQTEMLAEAFPGYEAPLTAPEMAEYIADFALNGSRYFNGKILPVSLSTP